MALVGYGTEKKRLTESLGPPAEAAAATSAIVVDGDGVEGHLLDAVRDAIALVEAAPAGKPGAPRRKLVVVFSDGVDANMEAPAYESVGNRALAAHVVIDTIGWAPFESRTLRALATLARKSRGTARTCSGPGQIAPRFDSLMAELDAEYVVAFTAPEQLADGRVHAFQVTIDGVPPIYSDELRAPLPQATQGDPDRLRRQLRICAGVALVVLAVALLLLLLLGRRRSGSARVDAAPPAEPVAAPDPQPDPSAPRKTLALAAMAHSPFPVGWFVGTRGRACDHTFKLDGARVLVGSDGSCGLRLDDESISSRHCEVHRADSGFRLLDLGATNGVFVNGRRAHEHDLVDNDVVTLGRVELKFKCVE
jgi:hypothetical protein